MGLGRYVAVEGRGGIYVEQVHRGMVGGEQWQGVVVAAGVAVCCSCKQHVPVAVLSMAGCSRV